ncbi:MAG: hypothetical protein OXC48_10445, partial [Endozoicomonadaceae bacterium]|nr:hypothetical protein [Endozoicomonadaceae bacterium]
MLKSHTFYKFKKRLFFVLLFFITTICQPLSAVAKKETNKKKLTTQINRYFKYHNTDQKEHTHHSPVKYHKLPLLNAMEQSSSSPWSNAFNFQKVAGTQIDPRTGIFTAYIKTGSLISNLDHGPNINLQVNYNSNSMADPDGLGRGWSWNLTHFNLVNNQLTTSQGQSFNLQKDNMGNWWPRYHKLKDIQITGSKRDYFTITYINGLRETLNHDGYEVRLEQQDGRGVTFSYIHGTHLLSAITDDLGRKIFLTRKDGYLTVTSYSSDGKPVNIRINSVDNELKAITLSGNGHQSEQGIYMHYSTDGHLLTQLIYPTGLTKSINYDCHQIMKIPLFYSNQKRALCVVTSQVVDPGMSQPKMVTRYAYGTTNNNDHNYLGFNAGLGVLPGTQGDILFETPAEYTYKTSEDNGLSKTVRTYNKYHLLIDTKLFSDKTAHLLAETHSFFCRTDQTNGCAQTSFADLPDTYTLSLKIETYTWGDNSGYPAINITQQAYDNHGRIIDKTDSYGRHQKIKYCPVQGDASCPVEPDGWSLNTLRESVTSYPSDSIAGAQALPIKKIYSSYKKEPNLNKNGYILVLDKQVSISGHQSDTTTRQYYNNPDDYATYGLLKNLTLTDKVQTNQKQDKLIREYHYIISADKTAKTSYSTFEYNSNQEQRSPSVTVSLFTNQTLQMADAAGKNITRYHYDNQGRLIQADSAVGTDLAVSKHYSYTISPQLNQVIVTNPNGLQQKIIFDGAGRKLKNFSELIDLHGKAEPGKWRLINNVTYNTNGKIAALHSYDYRKNSLNQPKQLTTTYDYTVTGRILRKHLPNGEVEVNGYYDPDRCMISYTLDKKGNHSAISVIYGNILDEPVRKILLPESKRLPLSSKQYCTADIRSSEAKITTVTYDAYGRKISSIDPEGKIVSVHYNDYGRVSEIVDPIGDKIHNVYNFIGKVVEKWVEPVKDHHQYLLFSAQYNSAGKLLWQAGEDGKRTIYTYNSNGKPVTITTPEGNIITYKYNVLGLPVSKWLNDKLLIQIHYNRFTTQPDKVTDNTGTTLWTYSDDGKVQQLVHHANNNESDDYKISWLYNKNRKVIVMTNSTGQKTKTAYDSFGRISSVSYQMNNGQEQLLSAPTYDGFSRIVAIKYGSGMERHIEYNNYGQQKNITDTLADKPLSTCQYQYDPDGDIITKIHKAGVDQQATRNYRYDKLDNLISVTCTGSAGLPLCPRDTRFKGSGLDKAPIITRQDYTFNVLNRIAQVKEILTDATQQKTLNKLISYGYGDTHAPLRLQKITTQWNNQSPDVNYFSYDTAGNMTIDGAGDHMTYNAFDQIMHIITPDGKQSQYTYDGSEREVKQVTS